MADTAGEYGQKVRGRSSLRGRPPQNRAVMKHSDVLGGLEYLAADYHRQDFARHVHNEYLVGLIERGVHDVWCRGETWHAGSGTIATFAPGEPHFGGAGDDLGWSQRIFYLPEGLVRQVLEDSGQTEPGTIDFKSPFQENAAVARGLSALWRQLEHQHSSALEIEEHLIRCLPYIFAQVGRSRVAERKSVPPRFRDVRDFIHAHSDEVLQLAALAALAGCSKATLIDGFKAHFGVPPTRYLIQVRIDEARRLLRRGQNVAEVAVAVGFADQSHLTRQFKAVLGVTPARYLSI
ncbi:AraC family transcriptional regulator [Mesorhizobium sp. WSM3860]|uniref:AraC family transcriptional regulator n=1 Tax=Mesorhizobium sp. WSM3860 TaxID=2029403 RepID=UPI000BAEA514|nr:AraC family transcriptional regulator [Mesorhizobium sp. WSM3860]PBC04195.1 transcriptional regulator [Mesorhizobium sp. WSM3860]